MKKTEWIPHSHVRIVQDRMNHPKASSELKKAPSVRSSTFNYIFVPKKWAKTWEVVMIDENLCEVAIDTHGSYYRRSLYRRLISGRSSRNTGDKERWARFVSDSWRGNVAIDTHNFITFITGSFCIVKSLRSVWIPFHSILPFSHNQ